MRELQLIDGAILSVAVVMRSGVRLIDNLVLPAAGAAAAAMGAAAEAPMLRPATQPSVASVKRLTAMDVQAKWRRRERLTMVTAYTTPSAAHVDTAGVDMVLVGDSVGMVELGYDTTQPVTMDQMVHHASAVRRGVARALVVADMPFGSYEVTDAAALANAHRFIKECGADAVKVEGGKDRAPTVARLVRGGVAVMGHVGLTPQAFAVAGGFRAQGRTAERAREIVADALALEAAGAFAVVVECVPPAVARAVTAALKIPTIGIGAGPDCSGQVLVYHDLLGMNRHNSHHEAHCPKFCKRYADTGEAIQTALRAFKADVDSGAFPGALYSPYSMNPGQEALFLAAHPPAVEAPASDGDFSTPTKLY
jgi:3-methyl-2-oxobutanoate hydroxymethyltransferase